MTKGIKQHVPLKPNTIYTISAVISSAAAGGIPVAKAFTTSFSGTSVTLPSGVWKASGGTIASVSFSLSTNFTFSFDAPSQTITVKPKVATFVGSDNGTFTITDSAGQTSASVTYSATITAAAAINNNLVVDCSDYTTANWSDFNSNTTIGSLVANPSGVVNAQQITFPTGRGGRQYTPPTPLAAGNYAASIWLRSATPAAGQSIVLAYYNGTYPPSTATGAIAPPSTWTRYGPFTFTVVAGDNPTAFLIENVNDNSSSIPAAETIEVYGLQIEPGSAVTPFVGCAPLPIPVTHASTANATTATATTISLNVTNPYTSVAVTSGASHGTATASGKTITYTSVAGYTGSDAFSYTATNASGTSSASQVSLTVGAASAIPNPVLGFWQFNYAGPLIAQVQSSYPKVNWDTYAVAVGTGGGGSLRMDTGITDSDIAAWKAANKIVLLMVGGDSANAGSSVAAYCLNQSDQDQMYNSIVSIVDAHGFQGVAIDLESGTSAFNPALMNGLLGRLKSKYGSGFITQSDARPFEMRGAGSVWYDTYHVNTANVDIFSVQYYGFRDNNGNAQTDAWYDGFLPSDFDSMINGYGYPASKMVIGCSDNAGGAGPASSLQPYYTAVTNWQANHPTQKLRGANFWSTASTGYLQEWNNKMSVALGM